MDMSETSNRIVLAPAARREAPINFRYSVRDGVRLSDLTALGPSEHGLLRRHARDGLVRMWGSMPNKDDVWSAVRRGDVVLFYTDKHFAAVAVVAGKVQDTKIADAVWNPAPDSWRNILFFGSVWSISLPVSSVAALLDYAPNWSGPREFFIPILTRQRRALSQFDSVSDFVASLTAESSLGTGGASGQSYADVIGQVESDADLRQVLAKLKARSLGTIPESTSTTVDRIKRDAKLVRDLKQLYDGHCQVCDDTFRTTAGTNYSEAAHIVPLERRLPGIDSYLNMAILCATCHRKVDRGGMAIEWDEDAGAAMYEWQGTRKPLLTNKHIHTGWSPSG
jgi:hypothetical protein